ncbi:MAG TPA: MarR family transcriptional regulator [Syntrophothermus lipocalidus]|uniref:Transcriptional regulator, MarR family n=1 Tax=Syntrophothermus lipocalidus (strain DSM 12680 / TGB-C1) TaxID=643648 RepID=D7CLR8_SYNLT|nr:MULTISPECIES: MarR family transcriptional regulator [Syntrophothermus]ADI01653.1 transcriptional regulator, MarR family [Syntrophothermus lipocalidus DSM 12680]NSW82227.1 MarR family transcriptional regulator [Syntrophothermus sp.]HHV77050.1 MarR family transcriptional regulator [Syntrophothermus lipocalidus]
MELEQCVNFVLTKAQNAVHQLFKAELAPYGVTPGQYGVLRCLWDQNGMTAKQLADRLSLDGSTITGILDRMEQRGLIERHTDPKDRRALKVMLTEHGLRLKEPLTKAIEEANRKALRSFSQEQAQLLKKLLDEISETTTTK